MITGRILDEFGEPLADAQVAAMRYQNMGGRRRLMPAGRPAMTNDIGEFRLFAIPPGQYYLSATLRNMGGMMGRHRRPVWLCADLFPRHLEHGRSAAGHDRARPDRQRRQHGADDDAHGEDFRQRRRLAGAADDGLRVCDAARRIDDDDVRAPNQIKPDGSFSIGGLAPGTYVLQTQGGGMGPDGESASTEITLGGDDVTGVRLVGGKPSTASGRVTIEPGSAGSPLQPSAIRLMAQPVVFDTPMFGMAGPGVVNDDFTFELKTRPGKMRVQLAGQAPGWSIRAVRYRGQDITDSGFEFRANENITDLEVELTNRETNLSGLVTNDRGATVKDYAVVVFPHDREKWSLTSSACAT